MVEEPQEVVDGELEDPVGGGRPDGRGDRNEEVVPESGAEAAVVEEVGKGVARRRRGIEPLPGEAIEAQDVRDHEPVTRAGDRQRPGEPAADPARAELRRAGATSRAERHIARLRLDTELGEQTDEHRVRVLVVDDEARVDRNGPGGQFNDLGLDVAADDGVAIEEPDLVLAVEGVGRAEPTDAGPHDGDLHRSPPDVASGARARSASVRAIPSAACRPTFRNAPPRNGWARRKRPPRRMSAV